MFALTSFGPLPGGDLVAAGIQDLAQKRETVAALLVSVGSARLREAGLSVPPELANPELRLYKMLACENEDAAHGRYNALIRLLVSFERTLERFNSAASRSLSA